MSEPPLGPATSAPASAPALGGPTPPSPTPEVVELGTGEDAAQEQLDWGSIDDEDGAFGQLSEANNIQDLPEDSKA